MGVSCLGETQEWWFSFAILLKPTPKRYPQQKTPIWFMVQLGGTSNSINLNHKHQTSFCPCPFRDAFVGLSQRGTPMLGVLLVSFYHPKRTPATRNDRDTGYGHACRQVNEFFWLRLHARYCVGSPVERLEEGDQLFSVVYFRKGTLPQKRVRHCITGGPSVAMS